VGEIPVDAVLEMTDSGLSLNTDYYYRVYAVTSYGTYSVDTSIAVLVHTLSNPIPWSEDAEGALVNWNVGSNTGTSNWAITNEDARGGSFCITDTPGASYAPSQDTWIETAVDLTDAVWPVLEFWDKYDIGTGDWIRLEISKDGGGLAMERVIKR